MISTLQPSVYSLLMFAVGSPVLLKTMQKAVSRSADPRLRCIQSMLRCRHSINNEPLVHQISHSTECSNVRKCVFYQMDPVPALVSSAGGQKLGTSQRAMTVNSKR
ncbi:hypothetical protein QQF64_023507 [Cirrhinus molitorella]|uniref:Secreted protein n=1 Tax=Cirrhinus molitorella TaxID=172907 RepID=A0ABR3L7Q2_9TELE